MEQKEYGGYIELEQNMGPEYHPSALALNCGRNCLAHLIQTKEIKSIWLPYFLCSSVLEVCRKYGVNTSFYHIDKNLHPICNVELAEGEWFYLVNYYGQLSNEELEIYQARFPNMIADNAQSFFQMPLSGVDTLYTCRKFFGVPDGAYLYADVPVEHLETDLSYERMRFLLGRYEKSANEFYSEYAANNRLFAAEPVKAMSKLTHNLLRGIDYQGTAHIRTENFAYLHKELGAVNRLDLIVPDGAFMYPLWVRNGREIRKELQRRKIYVPTLWPNVLEQCEENELEYQLAADILPLPVDQRYGTEDMGYLILILKQLMDAYSKGK